MFIMNIATFIPRETNAKHSTYSDITIKENVFH
jgi:hypothetical protein